MDPAQLPILIPSEFIDTPIESSLNGQKILSDSIATGTGGVNPQARWKQGGLRDFTALDVSSNSSSEEDDENNEDDESLSEDPSKDIRVSYA